MTHDFVTDPGYLCCFPKEWDTISRKITMILFFYERWNLIGKVFFVNVRGLVAPAIWLRISLNNFVVLIFCTYLRKTKYLNEFVPWNPFWTIGLNSGFSWWGQGLKWISAFFCFFLSKCCYSGQYYTNVKISELVCIFGQNEFYSSDAIGTQFPTDAMQSKNFREHWKKWDYCQLWKWK